MYYQKNYWKIIKNIYRFKKISSFNIINLYYIKNSYIPYIFKNLSDILLHNGKLFEVIKFKKIGVKMYFLKKNGE